MSRWFRHYSGMMRDEKLVAVAVKSKQPVERVLWVWGAILESAAEINDNGRYEFDAAGAAYFLRTDEADILAIEVGLRDARRVDSGFVVRWSDRQFQSDKSATRQAAYRERRREDGNKRDCRIDGGDGGVTSPDRHVTPPDTDTDTETEEEKKESSPLVSPHPGNPASPSAQPKPEPRGSRIPDDFSPSPAIIETARSALGLSDDQIKFEVAQFTDYWRGKAGAQARKTEWQATLRVWLRKAADDRKNRNHRSARSQQGEIVTAAIAEQRRVIAERQAAGGFTPSRPGRDPPDERDFSP